VPSIFDRSVLKEGVKKCGQLLNDKTIEILKTHHSKPLPEDMMKELKEIEESWFKQASATYPYAQINH
jgi:hypothetical protein